MAKRNKESEREGRKHNNRLNRYSKQIDALYDELYAEAIRLGILADVEDDIDKIFSFDDYPAIRQRADELFNSFANRMEHTIDSGIESEWKASVSKNTAMVRNLLAGTGLAQTFVNKFLPRNLEAVHAFQKRKVQGMGLSDRVWKITTQAKREMELALDVALSDGRSAMTVSRDVRHLLREPNKLFRRVRDKHGNLQLSKAARAYHPGQGVYRSSARNAQRLARTEINMAYHEADSQYWSNSDIVLGIEVVLSNNHPVVDICDDFAGKQFPKWFKFTGWHPQCRCVAVPITPSKEEMVDYLKRMANGEDVSNYKFSGVVNNLPDDFKQWMEDNADRLEGMRQRGKLPYFVKENGLYGENGVARSASQRATNIEEDVDISGGVSGYGDTMPKGFGVNEQNDWNRNENTIEEILNTQQGWAMTHEEADTGAVNPNFRIDEGYRINCQSCVVAYEMRRRGFNVEALSRAGNTTLDALARDTGMLWEKIGGGRVDEKIYNSSAYTTLSDKCRGLSLAMQEKGRYHIVWKWKDDVGSIGHTVVAERTLNGKLFIYDPQSDKVMKIGLLVTNNEIDWGYNVTIRRVDNALINTENLPQIVRTKG